MCEALVLDLRDCEVTRFPFLPESRLWFVTTFGSSILYVTLLLTDVNIHFVKVCYAQCYVPNGPVWKRCTPEATNLISTCATEISAHFLKKKKLW